MAIGKRVLIDLTDGQWVRGELRKQTEAGVWIYRSGIGLDDGLFFYPQHRIVRIKVES